MSNDYTQPINLRISYTEIVNPRDFAHTNMYNNIHDQSRNNIDVFVRSEVRTELWFNSDNLDGGLGRNIMWQVNEKCKKLKTL